jgi:hypothetical protein
LQRECRCGLGLRDKRQKCSSAGASPSFEFSSTALTEIDRFFRQTPKIIIPLTVREILDEEIARKLA